MRPGVAALLLTLSASALHRTVVADETNPGEWPLLGGNSDTWHYSTLQQINSTTVGQLGLAWMAEIPSRDGLVGNPLIAEGVVYQSGPAGIYANDVRTGKLLWVFTAPIEHSRDHSFAGFWSKRFNRGLALHGDKLYVGWHCDLFAVDRHTGKQVWRMPSCDSTKNYGITGAPRVGNGMVFIGNTCADSGGDRGFVDAFDAETGHRKWRFYTMPGDPTQPFESEAMEMASKTWGTDYWSRTHGCASPWDALTYDAKLNRLYFGTADPAPASPRERAPDAGDELFASSIVAVDADTGRYLWHYKVSPNGGWNFDATMPIQIAELPLGDKLRRVVMATPKNGFFYVLDAATGAFVSAKNYTPVNWASRIDPESGRPVMNPDAMYWNHEGEESIALPGPYGAHNWMANSFSPATGLVYIPVSVVPTAIKADPHSRVGGVVLDFNYGLRGDPKWEAFGKLVAWNPVTQTEAWQVRRTMPVNGGVLATAGNLVFQGTTEGTFDAFSAQSGERLWSFNVDGGILSAPTTVEIDEQQIILVASGNAGSAATAGELSTMVATRQTRGSPSRLLAFKLGGSATLAASSSDRTMPRPPLARMPREQVESGAHEWEAQGCSFCHGLGAVSVGGSVPDLRYASAQTHEEFAAIVAGGSRFQKGMPPFPQITVEQLNALRAYILDAAWDYYDAQQAEPKPSPQQSGDASK
jgi:PQQ-dependent dehydrogenase (methanol/ethanol family)